MMTEGSQTQVIPPLGLRGRKAIKNGPAGLRRLPVALDSARLARRHGPVLGRILLWAGRARARHQLARLAAEAPAERLLDMGLSRQSIAREAGRWFWEDMEATQDHRRDVRQADG